MALSRRGLMAGGALLAAGAPLSRAAVAQADWPNRPVRLVVGFTAGSATDVTARLFAQRFSELWGQPVVVENVPGNAGAIGFDRVAKAPPDGYTLMWAASAAVTILPSLQRLPFDPLKDFVHMGILLAMPSVILVNNDLPVRSIADLIAHAKANPGRLSYGTPGIGTPQHIAGELLCHLAGIRMEHIPYRGAALADTLSGTVPVAIQNAGAAMPLVREGRLRGIGVTALQRSPNTANIPTVAEQGFPGFEALSWFGLMAPAGTPRAIAARVREDALRVLAEPEIRARMGSLGLDIVGGTPEEMRQTIARETERWAKVIADSGIQLAR